MLHLIHSNGFDLHDGAGLGLEPADILAFVCAALIMGALFAALRRVNR